MGHKYRWAARQDRPQETPATAAKLSAIRSGISSQDRLLANVARLEWFHRTGEVLSEYPSEVESGPLEANFSKPNAPDDLQARMAQLERVVADLNSDTGLAISQMAEAILSRRSSANA